MSNSLSNLILSLPPDDGATVGNGALMALLREQVSTLTDDDYAAARDALVDEALLGRGKYRGRSIFRIVGNEEDDADDSKVDSDLPRSESRNSGRARPRRQAPNPTPSNSVSSYWWYPVAMARRILQVDKMLEVGS